MVTASGDKADTNHLTAVVYICSAALDVASWREISHPADCRPRERVSNTSPAGRARTDHLTAIAYGQSDATISPCRWRREAQYAEINHPAVCRP